MTNSVFKFLVLQQGFCYYVYRSFEINYFTTLA